MPKEMIKIKTVGRYNGHGFKSNGAVDLKLKFGYEELVNYYMRLPLLRSENTEIVAKIEDGDPMSLGTFMLHAFSMDHDGEGSITFNSMFDSVDSDNLSTLVEEKNKLIKFMFKATVEIEGEDDE